jgi:hypothetical protein
MPFRQLANLDSDLFISISVIVIVIVVSFLSIFSKRIYPKRFSSIGFLALASIFSVGVCFGVLGFIIHSGRADWDEVYLFASAAENFAKHGVPGVSVSGKNPFAESSVDFLVIVVAGSLMALFPGMLADTAVVVSGLALAFLTLTLILVSLRRVIGLGTTQSFLLGASVALFPFWYLSFLSFMPTGISILIWTLFAISFYGSLSSRNLVWSSLSSSAVLLIRWDLGILAILAVLATTVFAFVSMRRKPQDINPWLGLWSISIPLGLLLLTTILRVTTFGTAIPSGLSGKSIGFDPAFIGGGLRYLNATLLESFLFLPVIVLLIIAFSLVKSRDRRILFYAVSVILAPSLSAVLAGGDWFPIEWARYTSPSVLAIIILALALILKSPAKIIEHRTKTRGVKFLSVASTLLLLLPPNIGAAARLQIGASSETRVTCLAKAGFALRSVYPEISTVASAEVNTVAFFAQASLTDLIGIVDSRIANVPPAPWSAGDILHRRANPSLIFQDKSDALYLWEGSDCSGKTPTPEEDAEQWNSLLNSDVTRYRAGDPSELFEKYQPTTIISENHFVRFLVKRSIASTQQE